MNNQKFVEALIKYVKEAAIEDVKNNLKFPPDRRVSSSEKDLSEWYNRLTEEDTYRIKKIISTTAHNVLFGVFSVLDGNRVVDDLNGEFKLLYNSAVDRILLNDPNEISLHELLNSYENN